MDANINNTSKIGCQPIEINTNVPDNMNINEQIVYQKPVVEPLNRRNQVLPRGRSSYIICSYLNLFFV
jgi:hypothetical protein